MVESAPNPHTILVIGPYRSGTSCACQVLKQLGCRFVGPLIGAGPENPGGFCESIELQRQLKGHFDEWEGRRLATSDFLVDLLRTWRHTVPDAAEPIVLKLPLLSLMLLETERALGPNIRWIVVERPPQEAAASLSRLSWEWIRPGATPEDCRPIIDRMRERIDTFFEHKAHHRVNYSKLLSSTDAEVARIEQTLELKPSPAQRQAARQAVHPEWRHVSGMQND